MKGAIHPAEKETVTLQIAKYLGALGALAVQQVFPACIRRKGAARLRARASERPRLAERLGKSENDRSSGQ
jgi:hypothetical protein